MDNVRDNDDADYMELDNPKRQIYRLALKARMKGRYDKVRAQILTQAVTGTSRRLTALQRTSNQHS